MSFIHLGDVCEVIKGDTGIQKAVIGPYPLVTTGEERGSHSTYQFAGEAVIVPLVSATGHGHASIKRIHYQKGRFAVGRAGDKFECWDTYGDALQWGCKKYGPNPFLVKRVMRTETIERISGMNYKIKWRAKLPKLGTVQI